MATPLRVAIFVVSDTVYSDQKVDRVIPALKHVLAKDEDNWTVSTTDFVPDDIAKIRTKLIDHIDNGTAPDLVLTSGGTGFGQRDVTPEAVEGILERHAPGICHAILHRSIAEHYVKSPLGALARPVAGTRRNTIVITLPGSPRGATECLEAIIDILPHACKLASGADSRRLHESEPRGTVSDSASFMTPKHVHGHREHCHGHQAPVVHASRSNDPSKGAAGRRRESPYPMVSIEDALAMIKSKAKSLGPEQRNADWSAIGYALARSYEAIDDVPAFEASIVDGYAACIEKGKTLRAGKYPVKSASHAGKTTVKRELKWDELVRITTGAPLPRGANAVLMVEDTRLAEVTADGAEELVVEVLTNELKEGENVRFPGSDVRAGDSSSFGPGSVITPAGGHIGWLLSTGHRAVEVHRKPRVAVLSTGAELVDARSTHELEYGQVRDTNRPTLVGALKERGFSVEGVGIVGDSLDTLAATMSEAITKADVLITTGGASMGELDFLKPVIERKLNGRIYFGRVNMKPGKPTTFGTVQDPNRPGYEFPVFALPGNPASAMVTFFVFVLPYLNWVSRLPQLPVAKVRLSEQLTLDHSRPEYHRAFACFEKDGLLHATGTGGQRSSRIGSMVGANVLIRKPSGKDYGSGSLPVGTTMDAVIIGQLGSNLTSGL